MGRNWNMSCLLEGWSALSAAYLLTITMYIADLVAAPGLGRLASLSGSVRGPTAVRQTEWTFGGGGGWWRPST